MVPRDSDVILSFINTLAPLPRRTYLEVTKGQIEVVTSLVLRHSVSVITKSGTTLCAQCPERKSELRCNVATQYFYNNSDGRVV